MAQQQNTRYMVNRYKSTPSLSEGKIVRGHVIHNKPSTQSQRDIWYEEGYRRGCQDAYNYVSKHSSMQGFFSIEADEIYKQGYLKGYSDYELFRFGHILNLEF